MNCLKSNKSNSRSLKKKSAGESPANAEDERLTQSSSMASAAEAIDWHRPSDSAMEKSLNNGLES
jgi:hypothetical protein